MKRLLIFSLFVNVALISLFFVKFFSSNNYSYIVASSSQIECLNNWKGAMDIAGKVDFPEMFEGYSIIAIPHKSQRDLYVEYSGCFYDSKMEVSTLERLITAVAIMSSETGAQRISFHKSSDGETVVVYGK